MLFWLFTLALAGLIAPHNCRVEVVKSAYPTTTTNKAKTATQHTYSVVKVADGDTVTLKNNTDSSLVRIRLFCIDAPEKSQAPWGAVSLQKLAELLPLKSEATIIGGIKDLYGRTVSEIVNNKGVNVNKKMTEIGMVIWYPFQKGCDAFSALEKEAKKAKKGVWADNTFEKPWDYRKRMNIGARGNGGKKSDDADDETTTTTKKILSGQTRGTYKPRTTTVTTATTTAKRNHWWNMKTTSTVEATTTSTKKMMV